ncbi:MAG: 2-oxoglutarate dehydrogenase E1 component [Thiobacillaceae bacterium]
MTQNDWLATSPLFAANVAYLEALDETDLAALLASPPLPKANGSALIAASEASQVGVLQLINAYRYLGVRHANLDPLQRFPKPEIPELDPMHYGLSAADMGREFDSGSLVGPKRATLGWIVDTLKAVYCGSIGFEYMHISDVTRKRWIQEQVEGVAGQFSWDRAEKLRLLKRLTDAETLEKFIHTRFVGQKRFSLEGAESLIPLLDTVIARCANRGAREIVMGMAHRGRINVLCNIFGLSLDSLFKEPGNGYPDSPLSGDVKYHQGFSSDVATPAGPVHVAVAFNPSHLEVVHPVVRGSVRARQDRRGDAKGLEVVPVILHGDAALSGQGVVMESLNMSQTRGFQNHGAIHIVINNQIGFTTSDPRDIRSTIYCTDVAKMVEAPVFHVNGDDPEAVAYAARLAVDYRYTFHRNAFIDLVCFRRHGHNEQDDPLVTQPLMYRKINVHPGARGHYAEKLVAQELIKPEEAEALIANCRTKLERGETLSPPTVSDFKQTFAVNWSRFRQGDINAVVDTTVKAEDLAHWAEVLTSVPEGIAIHPRVQKVVEDRRKMGAGQLSLDWGMAENLAYASLLNSGYNIRLSGQDSGRGTFFHRHAVWHDQNRTSSEVGDYVPLQHLHPRQGSFTVIDSLLSEEAVLAFEYGYATAEPDTLVIWEAQFGDFANGAQVVIDQFITSGEAKWNRLSGLTLMLPHGYEGQGPEHSSGRLERYLQSCAQNNIRVCVPSLPAQVFHLLRQQLLRPVRKPLILFTPKSLLRHPSSVSSLDDLTSGAFRPVIDDPRQPRSAERIVVCSGKLYFDLEAARQERHPNEVAIIRVEQLYPFPEEALREILAAYPQARRFIWAQEEPMNQGVWYQSLHHLNRCAPGGKRFAYVGRPAAAAPASGWPSRHKAEQQALVMKALELNHES